MKNLIGPAVLVLGGLWLFKSLTKTSDEQNFDRNLNEIKNKPVPIPPRQTLPPVPTITAGEALAIAQRQLLAMDRPGTDENELFRSLNGLNGADLRLVYEQFGIKNYYAFRKPLDLFGWYVNELSRLELDAMRVYWYKSGLKF